MNNTMTNTATEPHVLQSLRSLIPERVVTFTEALRIAEIQADRLLQLMDATAASAPTPNQDIAELPHIHVEYVNDLPSFGLSFWDGQQWIVQLSTKQTPARQRFTLIHQYKHIIDHGAAEWLYSGDGQHGTDAQAELAADHFASCALENASGKGTRPGITAEVDVRRDQTELRAPTRQCTWLVTPPNRQTHDRRPSSRQIPGEAR
jgi:hypothetical protein